ncbi:hypothetical protein CDL12_28063 [Handroanthus impetiginosus]|uniref:C2H2-type domain-containing protein n=1 Tax=Handroanthus impetiginosus TaxID=429701 RepID=A0A2G9G2S4_9LAMI|nr:hypothetical protein CDL12_28063 [Handroanthus impetiginosus]
MEQGHVCKISSKSCASGKSLGGHMRVHLAQISASKKAAKGKFEGKMEFEDCDNQSNNTVLSEEKIKNCNGDMDFGDVDTNNSYELRDNPKKSWRISKPKNGVSKKRASCKECGKDFPSLRALSSHVRSHSMKNGEVHNCKKCGKGFDSMRAMFGHMKSHSKKLRAYHDAGESLSDFENLCLVRRKRSRIKYGDAANHYGSSLNASSGGVSEVGDVEEAAACLMMLSRGVRDWNGIDLVNEFDDDDDDLYFGGESSCKSKKIDGKDRSFVCVGDEISKMSGSIQKKVHEYDDLDHSFDGENEMKIDSEVSHEGLLGVENEYSVDKLKDESKSNHDLDLGKNSCENIANNLEIEQESGGVSIVTSLELSKSKKHECPICFKVLSSGPALGGHKRAHYNAVAENITNEMVTVNKETGEIYNGFDLNFPIRVDEGTKGDLGVNLLRVERGLDHEALVLTN